MENDIKIAGVTEYDSVPCFLAAGDVRWNLF